ncbi:MAG: DUF4962 domain-containing protein [Myxococcota bacterium]
MAACQSSGADTHHSMASATKPATATPHGDEWLGPKDSKALVGKHPLLTLMAQQASTPRPELMGTHPRLFFSGSDIEHLRTKARTTHAHLWKPVLANLRALTSEPPAPPAQGRRSQNVVGLGIAEAALAYVIEQKPEYLQAAKKWMDAAVSYDIWGYAYNKPNVDLAAGHLLFGLGWGYDMLYNDLTPAERTKYRTKLVKQARMLFDYYEVRPGRTYAYSQNHVYIPVAGLSVAAYALYGEEPEAKNWAQLARAIMGRALDTYSADGYFYESFEYYVFAVPWLVIWTTAHAHTTGEALYNRPGFKNMHLYVAHMVLPDATHVFDFGDAYTGGLTRSGKAPDFERTHPGGRLHSNYNLLHATAGWFKDSAAQGVAKHFSDAGHVSWYGFMSMLWYDAVVDAAPIAQLPTYHHFEDHGVIFHRSDWSKSATAIAFKCGPPEGYSAKMRIEQFPDWHLSSGHAHPDANSLIIFSNGEYLTGDSGYSGVPRSDQHNTVLVNGHGQRFKATGHNAFKGAKYAQLTDIKLEIKALSKDHLHVVGDATSAYPAKLQLQRFTRELDLRGEKLSITDHLKAKEPSIFTALWHSDGPIEIRPPNSIRLRHPQAALEIDIENGSKLETTTEPNWMTGPGRPGSVQKGDREARGFRALVRNKTPTETLVMRTQLKIHRGGIE